jgi:pimeloyl-ACP methyl ester carboxylesterase
MRLRTAFVAIGTAISLLVASGVDLAKGALGAEPSGSRDASRFRDRWIQRGPYRIHVREQQGTGPAIVLMHGFPDNHHLYDRLVPYLGDRHVVVFDFLGWGQSDKPHGYPYTFANQKDDLDAVVNGLGLDRVVLVAHDASGPAAVNWGADNPARVAGIVALNTFYSIPSDIPLNPPEAIRLFSDPAYQRLTAHFAESPAVFRWLYDFQVGGFILNDDVRRKFVPLLYRQFEQKPSAQEAFLALNTDLTAAVLANTQRAPKLATFPAPVRVAFGEHDSYLTPAQGRRLAGLFPHSEVFTVAGAGHFPQLDAPEEVAKLILTAPTKA